MMKKQLLRWGTGILFGLIMTVQAGMPAFAATEEWKTNGAAWNG